MKWRLTAQGPIRSNNEYDGEIYDAVWNWETGHSPVMMIPNG